MFSGLIQHMGTVMANRKGRVRVRVLAMNAVLGDSIAVNGVCLTVVSRIKIGPNLDLEFDVSNETLMKTTVKNWKAGLRVNMEPALRATDALGGHIVQGHVDGTGRLLKRIGEDFWFEATADFMRGVVSKGSVAVDGVSLTAAAVKHSQFMAAIVPFTRAHTNLGALKVGSAVNLEADVIGKYVASYLGRHSLIRGNPGRRTSSNKNWISDGGIRK